MIKEFFIPCKNNSYRPRVLENDMFFIILVLVLGMKAISVFSLNEYLGADIFNTISKADVYKLVNDERVANGLSPLKVNSKLETAASLKLDDMFKSNYFGHTSSNGTTPWYWFDLANYNYNFAGENLAMNFTSSAVTVRAWMNSEGHRKNILLKDFNETGIALGEGIINGKKTVVVVQEFGSFFSLSVKLAKSAAKPLPPDVKKSDMLSVEPDRQVKKTDSISLQKVLGSVNLAGVDKPVDGFKKLDLGSYVVWDTFKSLKLYIVIGVAIILLLNVFVAIKVQHPPLIAKGLVLVIVALAMFMIDDRLFIIRELIIK